MNKNYIPISIMQIFSIHNFHAYQFRFANQKTYVEWINRPVTQTPQCTSPISHNAPVYNQNVHNSVSVAKSCILGYLLDELWNLWDRPINSLFYSLTAFTNKKSRRNDSYIGFNKGFRLMTFYPEAVIKMPLWYMYSVWNSTMFSLWNCI